MPAITANATKFVMTTDFTLDKIIYMDTGSFVIAPHSSASDPVAHGLPFTPLLDGTWSTDPSFALSYDMESGPASTTSGFLFNIAPRVFATSTNAVVEATNITGSSITVYYRIFGLEPSTSNLVAPHTSALADSFVINTDRNYTKLYARNRVTSNTTITHSLGHRPQVSVWEEVSGTTRKKNESDLRIGVPYTNTSIGTSTIVVTFDSFAPVGTAVHYRIYLDE